METITIKKCNLSSIIERIYKRFPDKRRLWFRGQPESKHDLIPSLLRNEGHKEAQMYYEFIRRFPEQSSKHKSCFEWLSLMQHYRLPTRLLDWTSNLLVALYFCCNYKHEEEGALFVFDPSMIPPKTLPLPRQLHGLFELLIVSDNVKDFALNLLAKAEELYGSDAKINGKTVRDIKLDTFSYYNSFFLEGFKFEIKEPHPYNNYREITDIFSNAIPIKPPYLNSRIRIQHGLFTLHGGKYFEGLKLPHSPLEEQKGFKDHILKIVINSTEKKDIMKELSFSGINLAALFPEMEYQAQDILENHSG